jgi:beta-glucanase (GH16 family)
MDADSGTITPLLLAGTCRTLFLVLSTAATLCGASGQLVWSEEFNTDGPVDTTRWYFETGRGANGWGNNELQYYTSRPENAFVRNGNLEITVRREDTAGAAFTSARMTTGYGRFSFKYGRVEARMKVPVGKGLWPAFWMMGESIATTSWPGCGEIDIMEVMCRGNPADDRTVLATAHWLYDAENTHAQYGLSDTAVSPLSENFHLYSLTWNSRYIRAFIDNKQFWEIDITPSHLSEFHQPFYLLVNAAVGGSPLGITSPAGVTAPLPQTMQVDYIRVYQEATDIQADAEAAIRESRLMIHDAGNQLTLTVPPLRFCDRSPVAVSIYSTSGRVIAAQQFTAQHGHTIVTLRKNLPRGIFPVKLTSESGCFYGTLVKH